MLDYLIDKSIESYFCEAEVTKYLHTTEEYCYCQIKVQDVTKLEDDDVKSPNQ